MACDPVDLSQFVVDLRSRHLSYWNQFTAPDPRAIWSNNTYPVCDNCDSDGIQDEKHVLFRCSNPQRWDSLIGSALTLGLSSMHAGCCQRRLLSFNAAGVKCRP
eukprot:1153171-Pelagomonas_calceolata.AAC.11